MSDVGRQVEFIRSSDAAGYECRKDGTRIGYSRPSITKGMKGVVNQSYDDAIQVVYETGKDRYARYTHSRIYENKSYRFIDEPTTASMTIESERSYALYRAQSTEVIEGYVPQVVYSEEIVWQGDPVAKTDDAGEALSKGEQSTAALKAAEDKIREVVKKQFA